MCRNGSQATSPKRLTNAVGSAVNAIAAALAISNARTAMLFSDARNMVGSSTMQRHPSNRNTPAPVCRSTPGGEINEQISMDRIMGLAVFGEKVAARTYALMADLKPEFAPLLRKFAQMEGRHGLWFAQASAENGFHPDRAFADKELGYLISQVDDHHRAGDFDALAVLQGFIVECLAISTYEPFVEVTNERRPRGQRDVRVLRSAVRGSAAPAPHARARARARTRRAPRRHV